jgi:hypothetical protein
MKYTDEQLKQALAKMLPDAIVQSKYSVVLYWKDAVPVTSVLDTELLHLCQLVIYGMTIELRIEYDNYDLSLNDEWQHHVAALAKVLGVEIV